MRRADLPGHRHADLRGEGAGRRQSDRDAAADSRGGRGGDTRGKLRPNSVDSITGENSGDNLGSRHADHPLRAVGTEPRSKCRLILKGGGCENTNAQYSLPAELDHLGRADRSLEGVRKCILHAVWKAQGKGCSPGAVGVCIGGDRTSGYLHAKEQLFRTLDDTNPMRGWRSSKTSVMDTVNTLGSRADGVRREGVADRLQDRRAQPAAGELLRVGRLRLLGVPASRGDARPRDGRNPPVAVSGSAAPVGVDASIPRSPRRDFPRTGREIALQAPLDEASVRAEGRRRRADLGPDVYRPRCGSRAPDEARSAGRSLDGAVLYHCGPVVMREPDEGLAGHRRGPDDQHPRGAVPGGDHPELRRARGHRQRRDGAEDACWR